MRLRKRRSWRTLAKTDGRGKLRLVIGRWAAIRSLSEPRTERSAVSGAHRPLTALRSVRGSDTLGPPRDRTFCSLGRRLVIAWPPQETAAMAGNKKQEDEGIQLICRNKRAFHEYQISDTLECGI